MHVSARRKCKSWKLNTILSPRILDQFVQESYPINNGPWLKVTCMCVCIYK